MECVGLKAPKEPSEPTPTAEWTVEAVCDWASAAGLPGPCVKSLRTECIDGAALVFVREVLFRVLGGAVKVSASVQTPYDQFRVLGRVLKVTLKWRCAS